MQRCCRLLNVDDHAQVEHKTETERIARRHTPREVTSFRVHGQLTRSRVHWHVHKSSLPEARLDLATLRLQAVQVEHRV